MEPRFVFLSGPKAGEEFRIPEGAAIRIGRDDKSQIRIPEKKVSRTHCIVSREKDSSHLLIEDCNSLNGTIVNGEPISKVMRLYNQDQIQIGSWQMKVEIEDEDESVIDMRSPVHIRKPSDFETNSPRKSDISKKRDISKDETMGDEAEIKPLDQKGLKSTTLPEHGVLMADPYAKTDNLKPDYLELFEIVKEHQDIDKVLEESPFDDATTRNILKKLMFLKYISTR